MLFAADLKEGREKLNHLTVVCFLVYLTIPSIEAVSSLLMFITSVVSLGLGQTRPVCDSVTVFLHFGLSCSIFYFVS